MTIRAAFLPGFDRWQNRDAPAPRGLARSAPPGQPRPDPGLRAGCAPPSLITCGWGTGGFKAILGSAWAMAELMKKGEPGPRAADFGMERFREGHFIDESVAAGVH